MEPAKVADAESEAQCAATWPWRQIVVEALLVLAVFALHGAWPVPDVNEAHYLGKAKSYWNAQWCPGDFFLHSADAHVVFYWTFGWLTRLAPLPVVAWIGRVVTWIGLAISFQRLSTAVVPRRWIAPLAAVLVVFCNESLHMAGEWFVGGVEAKGFAYILVLLGLEALVRDRWNRAWTLLGAASAFHVVIGGWSVIAAGVAWLLAGAGRPRLVSMSPGLAIGLLLSLVGIWPAVALSRGVDPAVAAEASRIYVFERLPHHLDTDKFKDGFVTRQLMLMVLWLVLLTVTPATRALRRLNGFVAGTLCITAVGYLLVIWARFDATAASVWLRFYWFRMTDVCIPLGAVMTGLTLIGALWKTSPRLARLWLAAAIGLAALDLGGQSWQLYSAPSPRADKNVVYGDWRTMCDWVADNTPADAMFLTPRGGATFKWNAGRSEVMTWKDIPQDAAGIVEWWRRSLEIYERPDPTPLSRWYDSLGEMSWQRLQTLGRKYHAGYAVVSIIEGVRGFDEPAVYKNASYIVYRLNPPPVAP